jgi:hypothetical protein
MADDLTPPAVAAAKPDPAPGASDRAARLSAAIRKWRDALIAGGPIARDTACWNQLEAALEPLAASLLKEI